MSSRIGGLVARHVISPTPVRLVPLTAAQLGVWNAQQQDPDVPLTVAQYVEVHGRLDVPALADAVDGAAADMHSGKLRVRLVDGVPHQFVDPDLTIHTEVLDLRDCADPRAAAHARMRAHAGSPIDILRDPLTTNMVLRTGDAEYFWYTRVHHIAIDGYGAMNSLERAAHRYTAAVEGREPSAPVALEPAELAEIDAGYRSSARHAADGKYWAELLRELPDVLTLAAHTNRPDASRLLESGVLDEDAVARLHAAGRRFDTSNATVFVAVLAGYLAAVTGRDEVVLSLPVSARTTAPLRRSAGMMSNVVPLRIRVSGSVADYVSQVAVALVGALRHQRYRCEDMRRDSGHVGRGFFGPMINVMLFHPEVRLGPSTGILHVLATGPVEDLSVNVYQGVGGSRLHVDFEANPNMYAGEELSRHHGRFLQYLQRFLAAAPGAEAAGVPLLDDAERSLVLQGWNDTGVPVAPDTLPALFAAQVARAPQRIAARDGATELTYRELDARANQLARLLIAAGIGPESVVALALPRSVAMVVAMYAIGKAGAAYLPLDLEHPAARTAFIVGQARPRAVLTSAEVALEVPGEVFRIDVDTVDLAGFGSDPVGADELLLPLRPEHTAYVIYTSGSTGRPKGVAVSHRAIVNRLHWMQHEYPLGADDVVLQKTPYTFDVSVWEFFWPLQVGAQLALAEPGGHRDPAYLSRAIAEYRVTTMHFVPSMLAAFLSDGDPQRCKSLRRVFCSGEALPARTAARCLELLAVELHNLYGPTEAAVDVTYWRCHPDDRTVPIGAPVWNTQLFVLDAALAPVPVGVPGELYLAGTQLARGYLAAAPLSAARFVANPYGDKGSRMYRTGDLARWRSDGTVEYLGRTDFQCKIRGLRIELGEIEAALVAQPAVAQAVCVARGTQLVGYVVAGRDDSIDVAAVLTALRQTLPDYMVPRQLVVLDALPSGSSGKVDRKALPDPPQVGRPPARAPRTRAEQTVLQIVGEVLGRDDLGIDDDFFESGGDSLTASRVIVRINAAADTTLTVRDLFDAPSVAELAARLGAVRTGSPLPQLESTVRPQRVPLSPAQQRIWFLNRMDRTSTAYNMPLALRLRGRLDVAALQLAWSDVLARHEILRTTFPDDGAGPHQVTHPHPAALELVDSDRIVDECATRTFDLTVDVPVVATLAQTGTDEHLLAVVLHHIAADGASFGPLARDLRLAYAARVAGQAPAWAALPVQYADYAVWQRALLGADTVEQLLTHWTAALDGLPDQLALPFDRPRPMQRTFAGAGYRFEIDAEVTRGIAALSATHTTTTFMVLHAALAALLARASGTRDIAVGSPITGRGARALDDLVGMFVNTVVLRTDVDPGTGFDALLESVRDADLTAFTHADVPFEVLVDKLEPERSQVRNPLFQVMLSYERGGPAELDLAGLGVEVEEIAAPTAKFDLALTVTELPDSSGLRAEFSYATELFDEETVAALSRQFVTILRAAVTAPARVIGDIDLGDAAEITAPAPAAAPVGLDVLFEHAAAAQPDRVAVADADTTLTYRDLDAQSNRLARLLVTAGAGPESIVALALPRSATAIVVIWAVAKAGAAYLPIDPGYPRERIALMTADAGVRLGVTAAVHRDALPDDVRWLDVADLAAAMAATSSAALTDVERIRPLRQDNPAYLIYTSGSTGRPKAVVVPHGGLASLARSVAERFRITASARVLHFASPSFDASVLELAMAIGTGATLVIAPTDIYGGRDLAKFIRAERITHAFVTPAALETVNPAGLADLGVVVVGGDTTKPELVRAWSARRRMYNAYGPSESTVVTSTTDALRPDAPVTIGTPIRGTDALVLDGRLHPVGTNVVGELYVSGVGLARGYHGRPGLTACRFVAGPGGSRRYRTGDLVSVGHDGAMRFLGRADDQVKIRGYRIELAEIDSALRAHHDVAFAHTTVHRDDSGQPRLVAYVTTTAPVTPADLRAAVRRRLPGHMVPAAVLVLDTIPLTRAGKLDRKALPAPEFTAQTPSRPPRTDAERRIAAVWCTVLGVVAMGVDDDFFELGGNSLLATTAATALTAEMGVEVEVRTIFDARTVAGLSDRLAHAPAAVAVPEIGPRRSRIPLAPSQLRMWFGNRLDPDSGAYNIAFAVHFDGALDVAALRAAVGDVVARHEALRTRYPADADGPYQQIQAAPQDPLRCTTRPADAAAQRLRELAQTGFDLTAEDPLRTELIQTGPARYVLAVVVHHIAADGWSMRPLTADLITAYRARSSGTAPDWPALPAQFADYSQWMHERLGTESDPASRAAVQLRYWTERLAELPDELPLPYDRPRPAQPTQHAATVSVPVPDDLADAVRRLAQRSGATTFMVWHAALAVVLRHLTGSRDLAIGTPVAGRRPEFADLIGMFVNTLVLRSDVDPHRSFDDLLHQVRDTDLTALTHADLAFERVVQAVNPDRSTRRHPLFQVALSTAEAAPVAAELSGLRLRVAGIDLERAKFDLEVRVDEARQSIELIYSTELFDAETIAGTGRRLLAAATAATTDPQLAVGDLDLRDGAPALPAAAYGAPADPAVPLAAWFAATVARHPQRPAVRFGHRELSYAELDAAANRVARALLAGGVGAEDMVALCLSRSIESVVAALAVAKTGAAYVPVDRRYPAERIRHMLTDSAAAIGVTTADALPELPDTIRWLTETDLDGHSDRPIEAAELPRLVRADSLAYVVYTSGSTGVPKGVAVTHRGLSAYADSQREHLAVESDSRTLHFASPSFDAAVLELLLAVGAGATMVIAPPDVYGGDELAELLDREQVSHAFVTPAALASIDTARWPLPKLRRLLVGGEAYGRELVGRWAPARTMHNAYGPTETTIVATISAPLRAEREIAIGRPLRGVYAVVLDERLRPVHPGVAGDLYLGGGGLARGYHRRAALTAGRFVADPFGTGTRLYRTGDVVRWNRHGELVFVGRSDDQVKLRGFRIELGEIVAVLGTHESVRFVHVEVRKDGTGSDRIVAYALPSGTGLDTEVLRAHAAQRLPMHMVPSAFVALDTIPRTPVGKLDRRALPEPVYDSPKTSRPAETPDEQLVADIVAEVLDREHVGAEDNFFAVGGNSLLATQVVARVAARGGRRLAVRDVFEHPTVAGLARLLGAAAAARPALTRSRPERVPVAPAQHRLWLLNRLDAESGLYNIPVAVRMRGVLDVAALERALHDVQQRHEPLRTVFPDAPDGPHQQIRDLAAAGVELTRLDAAARPPAELARSFAARGFDLTDEPPVRAALLQVRPDEHVLLLVVHHIAMDGLSLAPLTADLMTAYASRQAGQAPGWRELEVQYADFATWQRELLGAESDDTSVAATQIEYWRRRLDGLPDCLELPRDRHHRPAPTYRGGTAEFCLEPATHQALVDLAAAHDATLFTVVHTALAVLLHRLSGSSDIVVGTPVAGRGEHQLDALVGMFVGTVVLRTAVAGADRFSELLRQVRDGDLDAFAHADVPFERLVDLLAPARSAAHHPLFQVMLSVHDVTPTAVTLPGLDCEIVDVDTETAKFDLQFTVRPGDAGLLVSLNYATDVFDAATVDDIGDRFLRLLRAVVTKDGPVGDLDLLSPTETTRLAPVHGRHPGDAVPLPDVFARAVASAPEGIAIRSGGTELTYAELDRRSNQLARLLIGHGVGPEQFVALGFARSITSVLAMLAVAKCGAAFVPIDPGYPAARKQHMVTDSGVTFGLTNAEFAGELPSDVRWLVLDDAELAGRLADLSSGPIGDAERTTPLRLGHPAYVIYTSGSTGLPKGVVVSQAGISNFAYETADRFAVSTRSRVLHFATPSFDAAVLDLLFALGGAGTLVVAPPHTYGGADLSRLLIAERITHCFVTTAALATADPSGVTELEHVLVGGEACPPDLVARWAPGRCLHNVYGPTETTIVTTMSPAMSPGARITIGAPIRGVSAVVLDTRMHPVPIGVAGELYLAGPELARGYRNRAARTADRFVANPFGKPGERMYRTGDLVRWTDELELEYVGRADHQVKIRGFRIELGEIDAALVTHPGVEYAVTIGHRLPSGAQALAAYVKAGDADVADLRAHLSDRLPNYMVPQSITLLDTVPLTPVGKLDRRALPEPVFAQSTHRAPANPVEAALCDAFATALAVDSVGTDDNFFELGGNSLLATRVVATAESRHGLRIPMQTMFLDPTPAAIARRLGSADARAAAFDTLLHMRPNGAKPPLFCVHPGIGLSWCYSGLLPHLDTDRPVYGLQLPHVAGEETALDSICELAGRYVAEIRAVQPEGPYHLLGWSLGGLIAHEMAVQLRESGAEVALLSMLDSFTLTADLAERAQPELSEVLGELGVDAANVSTIQDAAAAVRQQPGAFSALTDDHLERLYRSYSHGTTLACAFEPGYFDGDVLFFTATDDAINRTTPQRTASAWRPFVGGGILDYGVDCEHSAMTAPDALATIGPVLARYLGA